MDENECGRIVQEEWLRTARKRQEIELDEFTVMPNHLHGIVWVLGPKMEHILWNSGFVQQLERVPSAARPTRFGIPPMRRRSLASCLAGSSQQLRAVSGSY